MDSTIKEKISTLLNNASSEDSSKSEALKLYQDVRDKLGSYHTTTLYTQIALAKVNLKSESHADAVRNLVSAKKRVLDAYHEHHPILIDIHNTLAQIYSSQGLALEAQAQTEIALSISDTVYGQTSLASAELLINLGDTLKAQGHFDGAHSQYSKALSVYKEHGSSDYLKAALKLGELFHSQARFDQAAAILEEVTATDEYQAFPVEQKVKILEILRESLHSTGKINEAAIYELARIQFVCSSDKLNDKQRVNLYHQFLSMFELFEIPSIRIQACEELLNYAEKSTGMESFTWAEAAQLLGECYCLDKRFDDAQGVLLRALQYFDGAKDAHGTQMAEIFKTLGTIEIYHINYDRAKPYLEKALEQISKNDLSGSVVHVQSLQALSIAEKSLGNIKLANEILEEIISLSKNSKELSFFAKQAAASIQENNSGSEKHSVANEVIGNAANKIDQVGSLFNQALQLQNNQQHARALRLFEEILSIIETTQGGNHPNLKPILEHIGVLHSNLGNNSLAKSFSDRAKELTA